MQIEESDSRTMTQNRRTLKDSTDSGKNEPSKY